ncbi:MAG: DUF1501 domain-containing protein [Myxococcota bacterium]|jgi:hypothetical protein|nr:DUF1501 domain-containing protein [Myxococcota bacterium]
MDRRHFLKLSALTGVGLSLPMLPRPLMASTEPFAGPYVIMVNATGGWDPTSFCDPKGMQSETEINPVNTNYFSGDIAMAGNIPYAPIGYNETFFNKYHQRLLIMNGIDVGTSNHDTGRQTVFSGRGDRTAFPSLAALYSATQAGTLPMSYLSFGGYDASAELVSPARVGDVGDLRLLAKPNHTSATSSDTYHSDYAYGRIRQAVLARLQRVQSRQGLSQHRTQSAFLHGARLGEGILQELNTHLPEDLADLDDNSVQQFARQAQVIVAAFKSGAAVSANAVMGGFDTHGNHNNSHTLQLSRLFQGLDYLYEEIDRQGLSDLVYVVVGSDFGRTPYYNPNNGKDHWGTSSMMASGPGITGNRVVGASDAGFNHLNIDPTTLGVVSTGGLVLEPKHIHASLRAKLGIATHAHSQAFEVFGQVLPGLFA